MVGLFQKQTWLWNDKLINIELGYCKILWFVTVLQINYYYYPSKGIIDWNARHWQISSTRLQSASQPVSQKLTHDYLDTVRVLYTLWCVLTFLLLSTSLNRPFTSDNLRSYKKELHYYNIVIKDLWESSDSNNTTCTKTKYPCPLCKEQFSLHIPIQFYQVLLHLDLYLQL